MRKTITLLTLLFLFPGTIIYAQTVSNKSNTSGNTTVNKNGTAHVKWKTAPFDHQVFIENKGQFNKALPGNNKIWYAAQLGKVWAYFTSHGIIYSYLEIPKNDKRTLEKDPDKDAPKPVVRYAKSEWQGTSAAVSITAQDERSDYYTYPAKGPGTIQASIFNKITYHNIYPGVDIEYTFLKGKEGFKYSIIVHPGADISKATLKYIETGKLKLNDNGNITLSSPVGTFTEHAPIAAYSGEQGNVDISYTVKDNTESFHVAENYDKSKTLVIDPWVTNPLFVGSYNRAYDVCYDYAGNVYAYGGQYLYQLVKFNSAGVIQWTFTTNPFLDNYQYYGDFAVDRKTGTSYITSGFWADSAQVLKVNTLGALKAYYLGSPNINEMWRAVYNPCYDNIIIGAGGTSDSNQACMLDTNLVHITGVDFFHTQNHEYDIALVCVDPSGLQCYMATVQTAGNVFAQLPLPNLDPPSYIKPDHFDLLESNVAQYVGGYSYASGAMNGMAASPNWLYLYNGSSLEQYGKNTGTLHDSTAVSNTEEEWGGIDVDACDDIYVGCRDSVKCYNSSLALQGSIVMPDTIYDLTLGQNNMLYVAGDGFVSAVSVPNPPQLISSASGTPSSCSACNGTATVNINCGVAPYVFYWSNGSTNQSDTGLCPGVYTVTVTDAACPPDIQSAIVHVTGENGFSAFITDSNPNCGVRKGLATIHATGGFPPYLYHWSNGSTNQTDTGLVAGTYVCIVTDNSGCLYEVGVTLVNPTAPKLYPVPALDSICSGTSIKLTISGAKTYVWKPRLSLSCDSCPDPTATPTVTTNYTVTGMDSNGCTASVVSTIKVFTTPKPIITGKDSVCSGYTDTLKVTGGTTYRWSTGATTTSINYRSVTTQTITVTAHNGMCSSDTSFIIHVVSPAAAIKVSADSVCPGDSVLLTGSGGATYKWSTGKTSSSIWINPLTTKTYTLHAYAGTCNDSATKLIKVISNVTASISAQNDTICPLGTTTITVTAAGGQVTGYLWNTGATTSSITVTNTVTNSYTATVYGLCGSVQKTMQVLVVPLPKPAISGTEWKCRGIKDTLTVTSLTNPTTYLWNNGKTTSTIVTGGINADSIFSVTAFNSLGCPVTIIDTVLLRQPPSVVANPPAIFCAGQPITLTALANGTYPPFTYNWSTGQTGPSITIDPGPDTTTTYTVTASNGCSNIATTTAIPNVPILYACCNQILSIEHDSANRHDTAILVASGNSKKYQWLEQPDNGSITCLNPPLCDSIRVITTVSTTYTVVGTDSNGCQTEQLLFVTIDIPCFNLTIPNVFTPTNPGILGLDDVFYIKTQNVDGWDLTIYDRWGKEMYHSTNPYQYWNGNTEGGNKASAGVYYYIISGTCQNTTYKKDGFVQLIR